jgi:lysophospholipase L1-like esterase
MTVINPGGGGGSSAPAAIPDSNTIVLFGDSITANNGTDVNFVSGPFPSTATQVLATGFFSWANAMLGQRFDMLGQSGVGGQGTAQLLKRIAAGPNSPAFQATNVYAQYDVITNGGTFWQAKVAFTSAGAFSAGDWDAIPRGPLAFSPLPGSVMYMCGTNDLASSTVVSATVIANMQSTFDQIRAAGISLFIHTITPNYGIAPNSTQKTAKAVINRFIRDYCRRNNGCVCIDTNAYTTEPSTGSWKTGYSTDLIHPLTRGAQAVGRAIVAALSSLAPAAPVLSGSVDDLNNKFTNGMFIGGSNGVATSWTNRYTVYEIDSLSLGAASAGTVVVSFTWQGVVYTTAPINFNDSNATVQAALRAALGPSGQTLPAASITVTGGPLPAAITITMSAGMVGPVTVQTATPTGLTGGTVSYTRSTAATATVSKVARTDDIGGEWQQVQLAAVPAVSADFFQSIAGLAAGEQYIMQVEFQADNDWVGATQFGIEFQTQGTAVNHDAMAPQGSADPIVSPNGTGVLRTCPFTLPVGYTGNFCFLRFKATSGTVRWGRASVIAVP